MSSRSHIRIFSKVALLLIAILSTSCGTLFAEPTPTLIPTSTPTPTAVPTPGPGPAFELDTVMDIPGISAIVGEGSCIYSLADEPGKITIAINGTVPVVKGMTCWFCMNQIIIGPNLRVGISNFTEEPNQGASISLENMQLLGPMVEETESHILSGPDGAVLEKVGAGFRLVSGLAYFVQH
jgi:hypothetical protein